MNKSEFIKKVSKKTGFSQCQVSKILKTSFEELCQTLNQDEEVSFRGFGKFFVKTSKERLCYNNFANKNILILARSMPSFKIFKNFREVIK